MFVVGGPGDVGLNVRSTVIKGSLDLRQISVAGEGSADMYLEDAACKKLIFPWAKGEGEGEEDATWEAEKNFKFHSKGFTFASIHGGEEEGKLDRWFDCQARYETQPYDRLAAVLNCQGRQDLSIHTLVAKEDTRINSVPPPHTWRGRLWNCVYRSVQRLYKFVAGYGYKPWRAPLVALGLFAVGVVLFGIGGMNGWIVPNEPTAYAMQYIHAEKSVPPTFVAFNPLLYAVDVFVPALDLGQKRNWHPVKCRFSEYLSNPLKALVAIYFPFAVISGWCLIVVGFLGPIGIIRKSIPS